MKLSPLGSQHCHVCGRHSPHAREGRVPIFPAIQKRREDLMNVGAGRDEQEQDEEERLEVEEGRLHPGQHAHARVECSLPCALLTIVPR